MSTAYKFANLTCKLLVLELGEFWDTRCDWLRAVT